jgi:hypothetical protein
VKRQGRSDRRLLKVPARPSSRRHEKNHEKRRSELPVSQPRHEPAFSWVKMAKGLSVPSDISIWRIQVHITTPFQLHRLHNSNDKGHYTMVSKNVQGFFFNFSLGRVVTLFVLIPLV